MLQNAGDMRSQCLGELHDEGSDFTRCPDDEDALARSEAPMVAQSLQRGREHRVAVHKYGRDLFGDGNCDVIFERSLDLSRERSVKACTAPLGLPL